MNLFLLEIFRQSQNYCHLHSILVFRLPENKVAKCGFFPKVSMALISISILKLNIKY